MSTESGRLIAERMGVSTEMNATETVQREKRMAAVIRSSSNQLSALTGADRERVLEWAMRRVGIPHPSPARDAAVMLMDLVRACTEVCEASLTGWDCQSSLDYTEIVGRAAQEGEK